MKQVFVGTGEDEKENWSRKRQKSPEGISYKLHCNLLVLFLLFIRRSKLEKGRENLGNFITFLKNQQLKTLINLNGILLMHVFWTIDACCNRGKIALTFQTEFDHLIKTRTTCSFVTQF